MKDFVRLAAVVSVIGLAACDSDNNNRTGPDPIDLFGLQIIHGSPDAPAVNVLADGAVVLENVDYKDSSGLINLEAGTYTIEVQGILPGGTATVIGPVDLTFEGGQNYAIAALNSCGDAACSGIEAFVSDPVAQADVTAGSARLYVIHGVAGVPVDVYVTAPDGDLVDPITFDYQEAIGPVEIPEGPYQIRVTPAGDAATLLYDSGEVQLADGTDLRLAAVPNVEAGPNALTLVGIANDGAVEVADVRRPTALRVGHLSADTGPVDVVVNGEIFLDDVPFPAVAGFFSLPADTYNVAVTDGTNPGVVALGPVDLPLDAGTYYSALAVDFFANIDLLIETDDPRPLATSAKVRIIHAAATPAAALVDIWVTEPGTDITTVEPTLTDIPFKANTGYIALPAGVYEVNVAPADTTTAVITETVEIANGGVYTAIARDPAPEAAEFGLVVLADTIGD